MRILVVGAIEGGTVPLGRSISHAFAAIGHEAHLLDFSDSLAALQELKASPEPGRVQSFLNGLKMRIAQEAMKFRPKLILGMAQSPLNAPDLLAALRRSGVKVCYWFTEDHEVFAYWKEIASHFDRFFVIQKEPFFAKLKSVGCETGYYLPVAFDDLISVGRTEQDPAIPVSFVGAPYPNRVHYLGKLAGPDLQIFGEGWDKSKNASVRTENRRVTEEECRLIYQRSLINLNLHSSMRPDGFAQGDFVNPRTFDIAGLGQFQLTDIRELLPLHFKLGAEIPAYQDWKSMKEAIRYFLQHDAERHALAASGQARVLKEHTYRHRAGEIASLFG